jgi:hypothetical protein
MITATVPRFAEQAIEANEKLVSLLGERQRKA